MPAGSSLPPAGETGNWKTYPLLEDPELRSLEGYIDLRRVGDTAECVALVHWIETGVEEERVLELAPSGPSSIWVDEAIAASVQDAPAAVLGRGTLLPVKLGPGLHRITVLTCPDPDTDRIGFYLVERNGG